MREQNSSRPFRRIALICAFVATLSSLSVVAASMAPRGWEPSALVRVAESDRMADFVVDLDPGFALTSAGTHYDGLFNYTIALDPFARGPYHDKIDLAPYRYAHPGYGWLASLVAWRQPRAIPEALIFVNVAAMAVAAAAVSVLARLCGWSPWAGLLVAAWPGLLLSVAVDTSEPLTIALLALSLLTWFQGKRAAASVLFVALCLVDEPSVMVPVSLAVWEIIRRIRGWTLEPFWRTVAWLLPGPVAFVAWYAYLRATFGALPTSATEALLSFPFAGWIETLEIAGDMLDGPELQTQIGLVAIPVLIATTVLFAVAAVRAFRVRSPFDVIYLQAMVLATMLNWTTFLYVKDYMRSLNTILFLVPAVLAGIHLPAAIGRSRDDEHDVA